MKREMANASKEYGAAATPEKKAEAYVQMTTLQELGRVLGVAV
jgi:predicted Zn-dependent protease